MSNLLDRQITTDANDDGWLYFVIDGEDKRIKRSDFVAGLGGGGTSYETVNESGTIGGGDSVTTLGVAADTSVEIDQALNKVTISGTANGTELIIDDENETVEVVAGNGFLTGLLLLAANSFSLLSNQANKFIFSVAALTQTRTITWRDLSGTPALLSDQELKTSTNNIILFDESTQYTTDDHLTINLANARIGIPQLVESYAASSRNFIDATNTLTEIRTGTHAPNILNIYSVVLLHNSILSIAIQSRTQTFASVAFTIFALTEINTNIWRNTTGGNYPSAYGVSTTSFTGPFLYAIGLNDLTFRGAMFGISTLGTNRAWNDGTNPWKYTALNTYADGKIRVFDDAVDADPSITDTVTYFQGNKMFIKRDENDLVTLQYDGLTKYTFGTLAGAIFLHLTAYSSAGNNQYVEFDSLELL